MNWKLLLQGLLVVAVIGFAFCGGRGSVRKGDSTAVNEKTDTLYVRDTITVTRAVSVTRRVVDSVFVPVTDTVRIHDTVFVCLEREQIRWEDSLAVVYASGVQPQVDSVRHFITERVVTVTPKRKPFGLGVTAGYGVGKDGLTPFVGLGVSWTFLAW